MSFPRPDKPGMLVSGGALGRPPPGLAGEGEAERERVDNGPSPGWSAPGATVRRRVAESPPNNGAHPPSRGRISVIDWQAKKCALPVLGLRNDTHRVRRRPCGVRSRRPL